jgi:hypothetical protein
MYGLETIKRLNAQKTGDESWRTKQTSYTIADVGGHRMTFVGDTPIPPHATIIERV